jgi:hypothetical protein
MGFDFSAIDAELSTLGSEPAELATLARRFAGELGTLADVDRALDALGVAAELPAAPARAPLRLEYVQSAAERDAPLELSVEGDELDASVDAALTPMLSVDPPANVGGRAPQSGEIPLIEPVRRASAQDPVSGELALDGEAPTSGSFELPEESPPARSGASIPAAGSAKHSDYPVLSVDALDDDDPDTDDLFGSFQSAPPATTPSGGARLKGLSDLPPGGEKPETWTGSSRDPDAEFDAIFSDATSPSGLPTRGFAFGDDDSPSAEDLLSGLEAPPAPGAEQPLEAEDRTEIMHSSTLGNITANAKSEDNPFRDEEEFGSTDFEIVMDDEGEAAPKDPKKTPPPPLPKPSSSSDPNEKRPSFLGRIFGRKDQPGS